MVYDPIHGCQIGFMDKEPTPQIIGKCLNKGCDGDVAEYFVFVHDPIPTGPCDPSPPPYAIGHHSWQGYKCKKCNKQYTDSDLIDMPKKMTPEDVKKVFEDLEESVKKEDHGPKVVGECTACKGNVVEGTYSEYDPATGPPIIGPGSKHQFKSIIEYYCKDCGIMYKFPPKNKSE